MERLLKKLGSSTWTCNQDGHCPSKHCDWCKTKESIFRKYAEYQDLEERLNGITLKELTDAFIAYNERTDGEKYSKGRILTNQDVDDYDNRFWKREAISDKAKLGEIRI